MKSYVKIGHVIEKKIFQSVSLNMENKFYHKNSTQKSNKGDKKRELSKKLLKNGKWRLYDVIRQKQDMV